MVVGLRLEAIGYQQEHPGMVDSGAISDKPAPRSERWVNDAIVLVRSVPCPLPVHESREAGSRVHATEVVKERRSSSRVVRACEAGGRGPGVLRHVGREILGSRYSAYPVGYVTTAKSQVVRGPKSGKGQTTQPAVTRQNAAAAKMATKMGAAPAMKQE
jgi:hypothetical protein